MEKKMSWVKCIAGILISFIFYLFVSEIILSLFLPVEILGNLYLAYGIKSFICAIFFIFVVIVFGLVIGKRLHGFVLIELSHLHGNILF